MKSMHDIVPLLLFVLIGNGKYSQPFNQNTNQKTDSHSEEQIFLIENEYNNMTSL